MLEAILALLQSPDFWEKALLLILGAALTGILVPFVKARLDAGNAKRRKVLEAELARQGELIDSQIKLLREFSELVWEFMFPAFKVCYAHAWQDKGAQEEAYQEFAELSWKLRTRVRVLVSEGIRLVSADTHDRLRATRDHLNSVDDRLSEKREEGASAKDWEELYNKLLVEAEEIVDEAIGSLARDLDLSAPTSRGLISTVPMSHRQPAESHLQLEEG